jgi:probable rRNA maturation factor
MEIAIQNSQERKINKRRLTAAVKKLLRAEGQPETVEISILLVDDPHIQELNRQYRDSDRPTDVLAFSQREGEVPAGAVDDNLLGDVVVSVDTAQKQAEERDKDVDDEIDLLVAHGVLHLLGYDDATPEEAQAMQSRVREILGEEIAR